MFPMIDGTPVVLARDSATKSKPTTCAPRAANPCTTCRPIYPLLPTTMIFMKTPPTLPVSFYTMRYERKQTESYCSKVARFAIRELTLKWRSHNDIEYYKANHRCRRPHRGIRAGDHRAYAGSLSRKSAHAAFHSIPALRPSACGAPGRHAHRCF